MLFRLIRACLRVTCECSTFIYSAVEVTRVGVACLSRGVSTIDALRIVCACRNGGVPVGFGRMEWMDVDAVKVVINRLGISHSRVTEKNAGQRRRSASRWNGSIRRGRWKFWISNLTTHVVQGMTFWSKDVSRGRQRGR